MTPHEAVDFHQPDYDGWSGGDSEKSGNLCACQFGVDKRHQVDQPTKRAEDVKRRHDEVFEIVAFGAPGYPLRTILKASVLRSFVGGVIEHRLTGARA